MSQARVRRTVVGLLTVCVFPLVAAPAVAEPPQRAAPAVATWRADGQPRTPVQVASATRMITTSAAGVTSGTTPAAGQGDTRDPRSATSVDVGARDGRLARTGPGASPFGEAAVAIALCVLGAATLYTRRAANSSRDQAPR